MSLIKTITLLWYILEYCWESMWYRFWGAEDRDEEDIRSCGGKICVITGGNTSIGKSLALKLADRGATVVLGCRNMTEAKFAQDDIMYETKNRKVHIFPLDLEDFASVREFASTVTQNFPEINILINNNQVCIDGDDIKRSQNGFERHMWINQFGHFLLVNLLLPYIKRGVPSRIVVISSSMMLFSELDIEDMMLEKHANPSKINVLPITSFAFNNSKLANSLFAKELGRQLQGTGVTTYSVCPGLCKTEIFEKYSKPGISIPKIALAIFGLSDSQAAESILYCVFSRKCEHETGKFYRFEKPCMSGNRRLKSECAKKLWENNEKTLNFYLNSLRNNTD